MMTTSLRLTMTGEILIMNRIRVLSLSLIIVLAMLLTPVISYADPDTTDSSTSTQESTIDLEDSIRSLQKDYFMGILHKTIQSGRSLADISGETESNREDLNYNIITGSYDGTCSLYDRFGGEITFPMYLGEKLVSTGASDKIYTAIMQATEDKLDFSSVVDLINENQTSYVDKYYSGRPSLKNSGNDPRVSRYDSVSGITISQDISLASANWFLNISKFITDICCLLVSSQIQDQAFIILKGFFTGELWKSISDLVINLIPLFIVFTIVYVIKSAFPVITGKQPLAKFLQNLIGSLLSFGLVLALLYNPAFLLDFVNRVTTIGEQIGASSIDSAYAGDEIIHSDSTENVTQAAIWEDSVFKPWVMGTFGGVSYDKLYTTTSGKDDANIWQLSSDSASTIGDISVPVGSTSVKNWAALAYSCTSIYHIDSVNSKYTAASDADQDKLIWPKATFAGSSKYIYSDDFRWIDAYLKVGHYSEGADPSVSAYSDINEYSFQGEKYAVISVFMSLMLLPLIIIGWRKTVSIVNVIISSFSAIGRGVANIVSPESEKYNILSTVKVLFSNIVNYFWFSVMIVIGISLYKTLATGTTISQILYILIMVYLCKLSPQNYKSYVGNTYNSIAKSGVYYTDKAKEEISRIKSTNGGFKHLSSERRRRKEENDKRERELDDADEISTDENISKYGTIKNAGLCKIRLDEYKEAVSKTNNPSYKRKYKAFLLKIDECKTNREIAIVINHHRSMDGNKEMDMKVLGIPTNYNADVAYYNDTRNLDYDQSKAYRAHKINSSDNDAFKHDKNKRDDIDRRIEELKSSGADASNKRHDVRKLKRDIKKADRDAKIDLIETNMKQRNSSSCAVVPLRWKIRIVKIIIIAMFIWYMVSLIIGA